MINEDQAKDETIEKLELTIIDKDETIEKLELTIKENDDQLK